MRKLLAVLAGLVISVAALSTPAQATQTVGPGVNIGAMPGYANYTSTTWNKILNSTGKVPPVVVMNTGTGDVQGGVQWDSNWATLAGKLHAKGILLLGYVDTRFGARSEGDVENQIDSYFPAGVSGDKVDGIMFDEFDDTGCTHTGYYTDLAQYADAHSQVQQLWGNPGTAVPRCYLDLTGAYFDTFYTSERAQTFTTCNVLQDNGNCTSGSSYSRYRFAKLVYDMDMSTSNIHAKIDLAWSHQAGWFYGTADTLDNPWNVYPTSAQLNTMVTYGATK